MLRLSVLLAKSGWLGPVTVMVLVYSLSVSLLSAITPVVSVLILIVCVPALKEPTE